MIYIFMQMVAKGWNNIRYSTILYIRFDLYFYLPCMEYNWISVMVRLVRFHQQAVKVELWRTIAKTERVQCKLDITCRITIYIKIPMTFGFNRVTNLSR